MGRTGCCCWGSGFRRFEDEDDEVATPAAENDDVDNGRDGGELLDGSFDAIGDVLIGLLAGAVDSSGGITPSRLIIVVSLSDLVVASGEGNSIVET